MNQRTINSEFRLEGVALHTGRHTSVTLCPAEPNSGIRIRRVDLSGQPEREALATYVSTTNRGTKLQDGEWSVGTLEHLMAALYAKGITNCLVLLDGPEVPILNGSATMYIEQIERVGIVEQPNEAKVWKVTEPIHFEDGKSKMTLLPCDHYEVEVKVNYRAIGQQTATLTDLEDFPEAIAKARTFCFLHEILPLLFVGLIKGGSLKNALVLSRFGALSKLIYPNEPARHKLLDLIGDLALSGVRIEGKIIAEYPGHKFNTNCCKQLLHGSIHSSKC